MFGSLLNGTGASNTNNNWGSATGFGSQNQSQGASTNLFGRLDALGSANASGTGGGGIFGGANSSNANNANNTNNANTSSYLGQTGSGEAKPSGSLFGSSSQPVSTLGTSFNFGNGSNLFPSNSSASNTLFSNNNSALSNLFGSGNTNTGQAASGFAKSGLFSAPDNGQMGRANSPYGYDKFISNLTTEENSIPNSVTDEVFATTESEEPEKKKTYPSIIKHNDKVSKSSLISRLGQALRNFRSSKSGKPSTESKNSVKGIFTPTDFLNLKDRKNVTSKNIKIAPKREHRTLLDSHGFKKLVIKSRPAKFHLIDADKVLNLKKKRVITNTDQIPLENGGAPSDSESDEESLNVPKRNPRFPYSDLKNNNEASRTNTDHKDKNNKQSIYESTNGYWCTPSIEELSTLPVEKLTAIDNFIIGRVGFGQIAYNYPVDLSALALRCKENDIPLQEELFGKIVEISRKVVKVYHGVTDKPPIGFGLNIPATITLENITPKENESTLDFITFLRSKIGMEFVTYDPVTSVWVFKVKHFSIWGLVDDQYDQDNLDPLADLKKHQDRNEEEATIDNGKTYENGRYQQELKKQKISNYTNNLPGGWGLNHNMSYGSLNIKKDMVNSEIENQLALHTQQRVTRSLAENVSDITIESEGSDQSDSSESFKLGLDEQPESRNNKEDFEHLKQLVSIIPKKADMRDVINERAYEPNINNEAVFDNIQSKPNLAVSNDWLVQLELCNDINSALNPQVAEPVNMRTELERFSADKLDNMLFSDFNNRSIVANVSTPIKREEEIEEPHENPVDKQKLKVTAHLINEILFKADIKRGHNSFPLVSDDGKVSFKDLVSGIRKEDEKYQILQLGAALFDNESLAIVEGFSSAEKSSQFLQRLKNLQQREVFGTWLKQYNSSSIQDLLEAHRGDAMETIFIHICAGDLKKAISLSIESKNLHLAAMIPLLDSGDDAVKGTAKNQIGYWNDTSSTDLTPKTIIKIFKVLAGDLQNFTDLPWNIVLAIRLFYGDFTCPLGDLIGEFQEHFTADGPIYNILKLYNQIHSKAPSKVSEFFESSSLDLDLKWLLAKVLPQEIIGDVLLSTSSLKFGNHLLDHGLWQESIFVFAHLADEGEREKHIREAVIKNIEHINNLENSPTDQYLLETLAVPESLIHEASAIKYHKNGLLWEECDAYIKAELWEKAHECIVNHLGPSTVVSNDAALKSKLMNTLSLFPENGTIVPRWAQGAGIYHRFFSLLSQEPIEFLTDSVHLHLESLLANLPLMKIGTSLESRAATSLINRKVGDLIFKFFDSLENAAAKLASLKLSKVDRDYVDTRLKALS